MNTEFIESIISNNYKETQFYFPRLSKYLMSYLSGENGSLNNLKPNQMVNYYNVLNLLYHLSVVTEIKDDFIVAVDYFSSLLTTEELNSKSYFDFEDGYVYDYQLNKTYFYTKIQDACFSFYEFFLELFMNLENFKFDEFKSFTINLLTAQLKECDMQAKMLSNEYVEICFMQALIKVLNDTKELDSIMEQYLN